MSKLNNLGILVGSGRCNADCAHCCGKPFRPIPLQSDGDDDFSRIEAVARDCYAKGARKFSISGSGDPSLSPLSVGKTLSILQRMRGEGKAFEVKMYTNGILLGNLAYCREYLSKWRDLGLNTICVTAYSLDSMVNAKVYRTARYPNLRQCIDTVFAFGLSVRINVLLRVDVIPTSIACIKLIEDLLTLNADRIVCNQVRTLDTDVVDFKMSLSDAQLELVNQWVYGNSLSNKVVLRYGKTLCGIDYDHVTLFPNGKLQYDWVPRG